MNKENAIAIAKEQLHPDIYDALNIEKYVEQCQSLSKKRIKIELGVFNFRTRLRYSLAKCGIDGGNICSQEQE